MNCFGHVYSFIRILHKYLHKCETIIWIGDGINAWLDWIGLYLNDATFKQVDEANTNAVHDVSHDTIANCRTRNPTGRYCIQLCKMFKNLMTSRFVLFYDFIISRHWLQKMVFRKLNDDTALYRRTDRRTLRIGGTSINDVRICG